MKALIIVSGSIILIHIFFAVLASNELKDYPLFSFKQKSYWFFVIWLLPFIGSKLFHRKVGYNWNSSKSTNSNSSSGEGTDGGDSGC